MTIDLRPPTMLQEMEVTLFSSKSGKGFWAVHEKAMDENLLGLEYHSQTFRLYFVFKDPVTQKPYYRDLGAPVNSNVREFITRYNKISVIHMIGEKPVNVKIVALKQV